MFGIGIAELVILLVIAAIIIGPIIIVIVVLIYVQNKKKTENYSVKVQPQSIPKSKTVEKIKKVRSLYQKKDYEKALDILNSLIKTNNKYHLAFYYRGIIFYRKGDKKNAINDFMIASELGNKKSKELLKKQNGK